VQVIEGKVLSKKYGKALHGVPVVVKNPATGAVVGSTLTDLYGRYSLAIPDGNYRFTIGNRVIENIPLRAGGEVVELVAGENIAYGKVCYLNSSGTAERASNATPTTADAKYICISSGGVTNGATGLFKMRGEVLGLQSGQAGSGVWLAESPGSTRLTAPDTGAVVPLGTWISSTVLFFRPSVLSQSSYSPSLDFSNPLNSFYF
jgi:hypothetical protein